MTLFLLSIFGLGLGPLLDRFARQKATVVPLLEGFVAATILGLVFGHILPEAVEVSGWLCLPVAVIGLAAPQVLEHRMHGSEGGIHGVVAVLALAALFLHTLIDGAALATAHHHDADATSTALGIGVVLHRLPVGLTVWWLVRRAVGTVAALAALLAICAGTAIGFAAGEVVVEQLDTLSVALFQTFVASGLVHVVLHRSLSGEASNDLQWPGRSVQFTWSGVGALIGAGVLLMVPLSGHQAEEHIGVAATFLGYWHASAPYILLGLVFLFLTDRFRPLLRDAGTWTGLTRDVIGGPSLCSSLLEAQPSPHCFRRGSQALFWLAAVPVAGADAVLLSIPLLGMGLASARLGGVLLVAAAAAVIVGVRSVGAGTGHQSGPEHAGHGASDSSPDTGWSNAVDRTFPWVLIGFVCATFLEKFLPPHWLPAVPEWLAVVGAALLGAVISLPAVAAIPIALPLLHKGLSPGATIAFLTAGPVITRIALSWLSDHYGKARSRSFALVVIVGAVTAGLLTDRLCPDLSVPHLAGTHWPVWRLACSAVLGLLALRTVLRLGPGGMVAQLGTHQHDHEHNHAGP
jgi:uncharacterized protein